MCSIDADEWIVLPPGQTITNYLKSVLRCQQWSSDKRTCTKHAHAAAGIGSFMMTGAHFTSKRMKTFCGSFSVDGYEDLPAHAECISAPEPQWMVLCGEVRENDGVCLGGVACGSRHIWFVAFGVQSVTCYL